MIRLPLFIVGVVLHFAVPALGHDVSLTRVRACLESSGRFQVDLIYDVDAYVLGIRPEHVTPSDVETLNAMSLEEIEERLDELRNLVARRVRLRFDDRKTAFEITFPRIDPVVVDPSGVTSWPDECHGRSIGRVIRLHGDVPQGAEQFVFWASRSYGNIIFEFVTPAGMLISQQLLEKGSRSRPIEFRREQEPAGLLSIARDYVVLGFEHILPEGLDHILFVLGLFLLSTKFKPLLWQVTAFTLAHTATLALSTYDVIRLSPSIVEPLIALSIAYVAIENICTSKLHAWRPAVVFAFGLLHGMGFAGVLEGLGLPEHRVAAALVSFNVGVELGQLAVIGLAFLAVGWFRERRWYRARVVVPSSVAIAAVGLFWSVERVGLI